MMFEKTTDGEWAVLWLSLIMMFIRVFLTPIYNSGAGFLGVLVGSFISFLIIFYIIYRIILKVYPKSEHWGVIFWTLTMFAIPIITILLFVAIAAFFFGMMGAFTMSSSNQLADTTIITPTTTVPVVKFIIGDVVANTSTQTDSFWLILSYNKETDEYERARIYKNVDGSWGYRIDNKSEKFPRVHMEKLYPVKITRVPVSLITVGSPSASAGSD
jgi:hypothetical protein